MRPRRDGKCGNADSAASSTFLQLTAWIKQGWLKIDGRKCPNLVQEASLYTYDGPTRGLSRENPVDEHNHALAALRYLVMGLKRPAAVKVKAAEPPPVKRAWLSVWNEELWLD